jgi:hypothetical protein
MKLLWMLWDIFFKIEALKKPIVQFMAECLATVQEDVQRQAIKMFPPTSSSEILWVLTDSFLDYKDRY